MKTISLSSYYGAIRRGLSRCELAILAISLGCAALTQSVHAQVSVLTQHNDQWRTGANTSETTLTPSNVNKSTFGKLYSYAVDGYVYAQPLYVHGLSISGAVHNVLFVATMEDSVYAFDADTNVMYWHKQFTGGNITPVPITDITGNNNLNIHGDVGIESTPVIDSTTSTIYVLARTKNTSTTTYYQMLHALDLATGTEKFSGPASISPSGFSTKMQNQRPGLAEANGSIYICWGSHEDKTPYNGYVMTFNASTLALQTVFDTTSGGSEGAVWQAGQAPAFDQSGNAYISTGNGDWNGTTQWGETCLKLSPSLGVLDWATPADYASLNAGDTDFGAAGCMLLPNLGSGGYPNTSYVVTGGKEGIIYVLDKSNGMGHETSGNTGMHQLFQAIQTTQCTHHIHGTPVYWDSSTNGPMIYVWGENDIGKSFKFNGTTFTTTPFTETSVTSPTTGCGMPGAILSLSANGNTNGIVWASCVYTGDAVHDIVPGILRAYSADNLGTELWDSYQDQSRDDFGNLAKYCPPTVVNGKVYMSTFSDTVAVYGLLTDDAPPIGNATYKIISRSSGLALGVVGMTSTNSSDTDIETYTGAASQQWKLTYLGGGAYKIVGTGSGKALDVTGQSVAPGALIDIYTDNGQQNQQWVIEPSSGGYCTVQGVQSGLMLDVQGNHTAPGTPVDQWTSTGANNQQWEFESP
jgi:hypothetical protein